MCIYDTAFLAHAGPFPYVSLFLYIHAFESVFIYMHVNLYLYTCHTASLAQAGLRHCSGACQQAFLSRTCTYLYVRE